MTQQQPIEWTPAVRDILAQKFNEAIAAGTVIYRMLPDEPERPWELLSNEILCAAAMSQPMPRCICCGATADRVQHD